MQNMLDIKSNLFGYNFNPIKENCLVNVSPYFTVSNFKHSKIQFKMFGFYFKYLEMHMKQGNLFYLFV